MKAQATALPGVLIITPKKFGDERGFFVETFQAERYRALGIAHEFVQDNHSRSARGVLRGLHFQRNHPQGKLVRVSRGSVFDVVVDINPVSPTYGQHVSAVLSDNNGLQLWIPPGYAHGFCVLSDLADFEYKCTEYYRPDDEGGLLWNDPALAIEWPLSDPILSSKDQRNPTLKQLRAGADV